MKHHFEFIRYILSFQTHILLRVYALLLAWRAPIRSHSSQFGGVVFHTLSGDHTTTWHAFVDSACIVIGISAGLYAAGL